MLIESAAAFEGLANYLKRCLSGNKKEVSASKKRCQAIECMKPSEFKPSTPPGPPGPKAAAKRKPTAHYLDLGAFLEELRRRTGLLDEYRSAIKENVSHKRLYESPSSGIYKAEFYRWLRGELPSSSRTSQNLEGFLRSKKPPI